LSGRLKLRFARRAQTLVAVLVLIITVVDASLVNFRFVHLLVLDEPPLSGAARVSTSSSSAASRIPSSKSKRKSRSALP
jgi:hypothetical protein